MASDYFTLESEEVKAFFASIDRTVETLQLADKNYRPAIGSEHYLSSEEVCDLLHIHPGRFKPCATDGKYRLL